MTYEILIYIFQSENVAILRDGNSTIYPLSKDCVDSIKDPHWPDLPPVSCLGVATHFLHGAGAHQKNHVALLVLALNTQTLMPKILRCDPEGVRQVLALIESEPSGKFYLLFTYFFNHLCLFIFFSHTHCHQ